MANCSGRDKPGQSQRRNFLNEGFQKRPHRSRQLLGAGNVNVTDDYSWTPLMRACRRGYLEVVNLLLDKGADLEAKDQYGATALIIASSEFRVDVVKMLLDKGADVNTKDRNGWTALMWATSMGHMQIVKLLQSHGAK
jgi:ankyrin repeat protein